MSKKKRKYDKDYLKYGFIDTTVNGQVVPQCVICFENLSNDALRPSRLQAIFKENTLAIRINLWLFFKAKRTLLKE